MGQLYKITFSTSGKSYIGISSISAASRWAVHSKGAKGTAIGNAFNKYGEKDALLEVLAESDSWEELCDMERNAIVEHKTKYPNGYNLTDGGEGTVGYELTDEDRKACGASQRARWNEENRKSHGEKQKKRFSSKSAREEMSKKKIEFYELNPEIKQVIGKKSREFLERNPAEKVIRIERLKEASIKRNSNPDERKKLSIKSREFYINNPIARIRAAVAGATSVAKREGRQYSPIRLDNGLVKLA